MASTLFLPERRHRDCALIELREILLNLLLNLHACDQQRLIGGHRQAGIIDYLQFRHHLAGQASRLGTQAVIMINLQTIHQQGEKPHACYHENQQRHHYLNQRKTLGLSCGAP
jgi:hypothetical protein